MDKFSILSIPAYMQKKYAKNCLGVTVDYMRFNIRDRKIFSSIIPMRESVLDLDNSNVEYIGGVSIQRVYSSRGVAFIYSQAIHYPWEEHTAKPVPFMFVEVYDPGQSLRGSIGRVDFYGAYFHFEEHIDAKFRECYSELLELSENQKNRVRRTRLDIAVDVGCEFPQNGGKWITPSANAKRGKKCYSTEWKWNSYSYLSQKNTGYWVRMYNKIIDTISKKKNGWYSEVLEKVPHWTRIEFELYPPYSSDIPFQDIISGVKECVLWTNEVYSLGLKYRKTEWISIEAVNRYFEAYAERHMLGVDYIIDELVKYRKSLTWDK